MRELLVRQLRFRACAEPRKAGQSEHWFKRNYFLFTVLENALDYDKYAKLVMIAISRWTFLRKARTEKRRSSTWSINSSTSPPEDQEPPPTNRKNNIGKESNLFPKWNLPIWKWTVRGQARSLIWRWPYIRATWLSVVTTSDIDGHQAQGLLKHWKEVSFFGSFFDLVVLD